MKSLRLNLVAGKKINIWGLSGREGAIRRIRDDLEDAVAASAAIDAFEAEGRRSRPLSLLEAEPE